MKKLALSAILGASLMVTSSAFALTSMSDSNMKAATGQAGVSIAIDNVVIESFTGSTTYTDSDGYLGNAGSVVISDKHVLKTYLAMVSEDDFIDDFTDATGLADADVRGDWNKAAALSIDVGECSVLSAGLNDNVANLGAGLATVGTALTQITTDMTGGATLEEATATAVATLITAGVADNLSEAKIYLGAVGNGVATEETVTGVVIGLPTLIINTSEDSYSVGVKMEGAINTDTDFIHIAKGASSMAILSGTVEIAAH